MRSPSSIVNLRSFLDFGTASQAKILTALKSDFAKVSKSTNSSKSGSIFTFEKSIFSGVEAVTGLFSIFLGASSGFIVGKRITSLMLTDSVISITSLSTPIPIPPVGGIPYSSAVRKSSSIILASSSPAARIASWCSKRFLWSIGSFNSE